MKGFAFYNQVFGIDFKCMSECQISGRCILKMIIQIFKLEPAHFLFFA